MLRFIAFVALVLGSLSIGSVQPAAGQESGATPGAAPPLAEFVREIPISPDPISAPGGVAADAAGTLYVADTQSNMIRVFDREGNAVATWGSAGTGPGQFRFVGPDGFWGDLALGPDGNVYVMDTFNNRVQVLAPDGTFLREWGETGSGEGQFMWPEGITFDGAGRVYVADSYNARVQVFTSDGEFLAAWAPAADAIYSEPADVAVDAAGTVWVTDYARSVVYRFDAAGDQDGRPAEPGVEVGDFLVPWGAAIDAQGNLYVAENANGRVQVFAPDGTPLGSIGERGSGPGQFITPIYVTVGQDGLLYVADETNRRVQVFRLLPPLGAAAGTPAPA